MLTTTCDWVTVKLECRNAERNVEWKYEGQI